MNAIRALLLIMLAIVSIGRAAAQVDGAASQILIPVASSSSSFVSEIILKDQSGTSRSVTMQFYEAQTSATPGLKACAAVSLQPFETKTVTLAAQCTLAPGSHHGFILLTDATGNREKLFYAYSRVANPAGIGFSVEGYPIGHIGGGETYSEVVGVKRLAAAAGSPAFQTNCFVATLNDPVDYEVSVDAAGAQPITDSLGAFQMRRYLDIYASTGAAAGNHANNTVTFQKIDPSQFKNTMLAFCTVQENATFGADFRISKNWNAADPSRFRLNCFAAVYGDAPGECTGTLQPSAPEVSAGTKVRLITRVYAPDTVNCSIISTRAAELELRLFRDFPAGVVAGGNNVSSFTYATGARSTFGSGYHQYYFLEVGPRTGVTGFPIPFGIRCMSGNGMMDPRFFGTAAHDF